MDGWKDFAPIESFSAPLDVGDLLSAIVTIAKGCIGLCHGLQSASMGLQSVDLGATSRYFQPSE